MLRKVKTLVGLRDGAVGHLADDGIGASFSVTIIHGCSRRRSGYLLADLQVIHEAGIIGGDDFVAADERLALDGDRIPLLERHGVIFDGADADFRAAQVGHDRDGACRAGTNGVDVLLFLFQRAMRKIQPCHGDAGIDQL